MQRRKTPTPKTYMFSPLPQAGLRTRKVRRPLGSPPAPLLRGCYGPLQQLYAGFNQAPRELPPISSDDENDNVQAPSPCSGSTATGIQPNEFRPGFVHRDDFSGLEFRPVSSEFCPVAPATV